MADVTREHFSTHVDRRLRNRIRIYIAISAILAAVVVFRIFQEGVNFWYPLLALVAGGGIGVIFSRMFKIHWDEDGGKVMSRLDATGGIILAAYVAFEITSRRLLESYFAGPLGLTIVLSLVSGIILGRGLGMARSIRSVLRENI